jgi:hypothetical protein
MVPSSVVIGLSILLAINSCIALAGLWRIS